MRVRRVYKIRAGNTLAWIVGCVCLLAGMMEQNWFIFVLGIIGCIVGIDVVVEDES